MAQRKIAINTWRKENFAMDSEGKLLPGALSLPTLRKMIDDDPAIGERVGHKYYLYVDNDNNLISQDELVRRVLEG